MSDETKRNVFKDVVETLNVMDGAPDDYCKELIDNYDASLPDNLPVIPEEVGEYLKTHRKDLLGEIFWKLGCKSSAFLDSNELYIVLNSDTFAHAWVLGIWIIEETGEIVKLGEIDDGD